MQPDARKFVVLFHTDTAEPDHFDLMIDDGHALTTWRVDCPPETATHDEPAICLRIGDHRRDYLTYEGPVSKNRGHVRRHDAGNCIVENNARSALLIRFEGERLRGVFQLTGDVSGDGQSRLAPA